MGRQAILVAALAALVSTAAVASPYADFTRYQVIIDSELFGEAPPPAPTLAPVAAAPAVVPPFVKNYRMCAITDDSLGVRVGFINVKSKPERSYFLRVGDSEDGIELVEADYEREAALLRSEGKEAWIYMDGEPEAAGGVAAASPAAARPAATARPAVTAAPSPGGQSYRDRLAARARERQRILDERRQQAKKAAEEVSGEELVTRLQEYQMELIRAQGKKGPVLPIPLTEEMDDQLVAEGVLPPRE